jgi:valyl-tRNA synthetase
MPDNNLDKIYDPSQVEDKWYQQWDEAGTFQPDKDQDKLPFTITIPPPNVTGILTIGHVLNNTVQDVLVRRARMQNKNTLWLPGTDHASIATEAKVTKSLKDQKINKREIGRDAFLGHAWDWTENYGGIIIKQLKKLGCSCDWTREKFTMDDDYSKSVLESFVRLYDDGLIYRGERIINWDPVGLTALSDEEVIYEESNSSLWYFKYPIKDSDSSVIVATTRPETMLGDTGIAVNPEDIRYQHLIGKSVILPLVNREIPIFADSYVDKDFGTGCVKVTPAHDPNDYDMGQRHGLEIVNIMNPDATLNEKVPEQYRNLDRYEAREAVINDLKDLELLVKIEDYVNNVGHSERTHAVVEPYLSKQWFVKMEPLAKPALQVVNEGKVKFHPQRWEKTYNHWLENIRDWCISRQLWWGHRIPVWYREDEIYCGLNAPEGEGWIQDEDVLDTWFSSWLWPLATLGWPDESDDLKNFYPTSDLVTGPDIIFFWVARMIMAGLYFKQDIPFENVYFTGIIRDQKGRKMSKSLGNSPDPLDLIAEYGADALRVGLLIIAPQGNDILFNEEQIEHGRNFMNKLWNSARFVFMNLDDDLPGDLSSISNEDLDLTDRWILSKLNHAIQQVDQAYDKYRMNEAVKNVYDFTRRDFCDWYIEFSKVRLFGDDQKLRNTAQVVTLHVLKTILKLLHPYAPFITEEIWSHLRKDNQPLLISSSWPQVDSSFFFDEIENHMNIIMDLISSVRNVRTHLNVPPGKMASLFIRCSKEQSLILDRHREYIGRLAKIDKQTTGTNLEKPHHSATAVVHQMEIFIPLEGLIDLDKEVQRLKSQIESLEGRVKAANNKLNNKNFILRAPPHVVEHEQVKLSNYLENLNKLKDNLNSLLE